MVPHMNILSEPLPSPLNDSGFVGGTDSMIVYTGACTARTCFEADKFVEMGGGEYQRGLYTLLGLLAGLYTIYSLCLVSDNSPLKNKKERKTKQVETFSVKHISLKTAENDSGLASAQPLWIYYFHRAVLCPTEPNYRN